MVSLQASKTNPGLRVPPEVWPSSLQEYLAGGQDLFSLEEHFANWLHAQVPYDIIFVRWGAEGAGSDEQSAGLCTTGCTSR